jgi:hypothetical protein
VGLAAGREGAGNGEEDDLLVRPFFASIVFLGTAARGGVAVGNGCPSTWKRIMSAYIRRALVVSEARYEGTYSNLTPSGSLSPTCRGAMMIIRYKCIEFYVNGVA